MKEHLHSQQFQKQASVNGVDSPWRNAFMQNALEAVIGIDSHNQIIDWNHHASDLFGLGAEEALGKNLPELLLMPQSHDIFLQELQSIKVRSAYSLPGIRPILEAKGPHASILTIELMILPLPIGETWYFYFSIRKLGHQSPLQEARLKISEMRFRTLFEQIPFSMQLLDCEGRTLQVNKAWQNLWDVSEDFIQDYILKEYNILQDEQLIESGVHSQLQKCLAGESVQIPPVLYQPANGLPGRSRWVEAFLYPLKDLEGKVREMVLMHEDITDHLNTRKTIMQNAECFQLLADSIKDYAIFMLDPLGHVISWNNGAERIKGYKADEILGKHFSIFYLPEQVRDHRPQRALEIAAKEGRYEEEGLRSKKDGSHFWAHVIITPLKNENGHVKGYSKITRDISAAKIADEEKKMFIATIENSTDFIGISDMFHNVLYINPAGKIMVGLSKDEEVKGKHVSQFFTEQEYGRLSELALPQLLSEGRWEGEVNFYNENNHCEISALMTTFLIFDQQGTPIAMANVSRNITEIKLTQKKLEEAIRFRDEFISICSHELKTPLTSLKLLNQMAAMQIKKGDTKVYSAANVDGRVALTNDQLDRMGQLIEDMLDVAFLNEGRLRMKMEAIDANELAREVIERMSPQFRLQEIPLTVSYEKGPLRIKGDKYRIEQVLVNLLSNTLKYGQKRPVQVQLERSGDKVIFTVKDQGIGIAEKDLQKIFHCYERAISSENISGLGLGLYICKQIIDFHHGLISVQSQVGRGSTFKVELPLWND